MKFEHILLIIMFSTICLNTACGSTDDDSYANYGDISSVVEDSTKVENTSVLDIENNTSEDSSTSKDETVIESTSITSETVTTTIDSSSNENKKTTTTSVKSSKNTTNTSNTSVGKVTTEKVTTMAKNNDTPVENISNNVDEDIPEESVIGVIQVSEEVQVSSVTPNGVFEDSDMLLTYNGQSISVDMPMTDILALIGEPYDYQSNLGCYNEWNDEVYIYNSIQIDANTYDGNIYQARIITILNSNIATSKGVAIGSTFDDMKNAYGEQYLDLDNTYNKGRYIIYP